MFANLMAEVEALRKARTEYGVLEAIVFIDTYKDEYSAAVRKELVEFFRQGRLMFAPKEAV